MCPRTRVFAATGLAVWMTGAACSTDPKLYSRDDGGASGGGAQTGGMTNGGTGSGSSGRDGAAGAGSGAAGTGGVLLPPSTGMNPPPVTAPTAEKNCGLEKTMLERQPAELLLVLDRSTSMLNGLGRSRDTTGPNRWDTTVMALDRTIMNTQAGVFWGLKMYPVGGECGVGDGVEVMPALNNYGSLLGQVRMNAPLQSPTGRTPTRVAMQKAVAYMQTRKTQNPKYILLATDGQPNCATTGTNNDDVSGAVQAVGAAATAGFKTFVVGIATAGTEAHDALNMMADRGQMPRKDPATRYYSASSQEELVAALESIAGQIASCTFKLGRQPPSPKDVAVDVDAKRIPRDSTRTNGWEYGDDSMTSIVFYGAICDSLKGGTAKNVQFVFGCPNVLIP